MMMHQYLLVVLTILKPYHVRSTRKKMQDQHEVLQESVLRMACELIYNYKHQYLNIMLHRSENVWIITIELSAF